MNEEINIENPFTITRTEQFNSKHSLFADYFEEPSFYDELTGRLFFIIAGTRGTGKSMILKSLYLPVFVERLKKKNIDPLNFNWNFIGIYVPCDNLDLQKYFNVEYSKYFGSENLERGKFLWRRYLNNYFSLYIVKEVLNTLAIYGKNISLDFAESEVTTKIIQEFDPSSTIEKDWVNRFEDLPAFFEREKKIFLDFVMEKICNPSQEFTRPIRELSFIKDVCNVLLNTIEKLKDSRFYILLDDFFPPFVTFEQQAVFLDLMRERGGPLSFKISTIPEGINYTTDSGYEMRPDLDYNQKFMEYPEVGRGSDYWNLIKNITNRRFVYGVDHSKVFETPQVRFNIPSDFEEQLRDKEISNELKEVFGKRGCSLSAKTKVAPLKGNMLKIVDKKIKLDKKTEESVVYTIVKDKGKLAVSTPQTVDDFLVRLRGQISRGHDRPVYAGFDMIVEMSSGVVGTYLLLAKEMVDLMLMERRKQKFSISELPIPAKIQDAVVRKRSRLFLGAISSLEDGASIHRLTTVMARQSREHFLKNPVATEYIQYKIKNYESLITKGDKEAHNKLIVAFRNNIFHSPDSYPTDRHKNVILRTIILNRLLTPALKIPYRDRWGEDIEAEDIEKILLSSTSEPLPITDKPPISLTPQSMQVELGARLTSPIIKNSSCRVFSGHYCTKISELFQQDPGAFLALPFRDDWHKNSEELIKTKIEKVKTALDISPNGDFTCKICEYIHKRDFGIYEISILNDNVIFEMGLSIGLGKHTFAIWNKEEWARAEAWTRKNSPIPSLIGGLQGIPYFVDDEDIEGIARSIKGSIEKKSWNKEDIQKATDKAKIFLAVPNSHYYTVTLKPDFSKALNEIGIGDDKILDLPENFNEGLTLVNTFRWILDSELCIIDSTQFPKFRESPELLADYLWRIFSLGVAVGLRKPLIHCFNSNYTQEVASDIRGKCTFTYKDKEIYDKLLIALKGVYNHEKIR